MKRVTLRHNSTVATDQLRAEMELAGYKVTEEHHNLRQPLAFHNKTMYQDFFDIRRNLLPKTVKVPAYPAKT